MLPWLVDNFEFMCRPIHLVRHPFAVVASQIAYGWTSSVNNFVVPNTPFNQEYRRHQEFLSGLRTDEELLVAIWCMTVLVPLRHPHKDRKWTTVFYENLVRSPETELDRVFESWGLRQPTAILNDVRKSSRTSRPGSAATVSAGGQLSKWKRTLSKQTVRSLCKVLDYFEVVEYGDDLFPRPPR
jgi:hypothetical protein